MKRLLLTIRGRRLNPNLEDRVLWKETKDGIFSINSIYNALVSRSVVQFHNSIIWSPCVPTKVGFFCLRSLVGINLKRGGGL